MSDVTNSETFFDKQTKKLLTEIAESEGFTDYQIEKGDSSVKGDGYMGIVNAVIISDKTSNSVLNLVVKSASKSDALRSQDMIEHLFEREIYIYDTVFITFKVFEEKKKLPPSNFAPKVYNSLREYKYETLILENLKESGYRIHERRIPLDESHVRLVLSEYGRFHALSFALRDQDPETFGKVVGSMDDYFSTMMQKGFVANFIQQCIKAECALDENKDKEALNIYKAFIYTIQPFFEDVLKSVDEYSGALHGDCWTNNMMFKYDDKTNPTHPTEVRFIDFQNSRVGSPALDLVYFFYTCSPEEIINNLDYYLQLYYDSFSSYLRKLGSDPDKMFPYSVLQEHWKKYSRFGLVLSLLLIHIMLSEKEEAIDLASELETGKDFTNAFDYEIKEFDEYKRRVKPIILHFVERNFI